MSVLHTQHKQCVRVCALVRFMLSLYRTDVCSGEKRVAILLVVDVPPSRLETRRTEHVPPAPSPTVRVSRGILRTRHIHTYTHKSCAYTGLHEPHNSRLRPPPHPPTHP